MLLKSRPKALDSKSVNIWEVGNGLWELAVVEPNGVTTGPMRPDPLAEVMAYVSDVLHLPVSTHSLDDIRSERLEATKRVTGTVLSFDVSPTGQMIEGGLLEFQPDGSEKIVRIGTPAQNTSVGLYLSYQVEALVGEQADVVYEILYASHGEENVRELCNIVAATNDVNTEA